ncbi:MAG: bifunctional phosphopantothenoylcysteine decarboxylase/phosphopantothenate--cysteine ligase CoaBC, partial [Geminicoccaceae bacterium]|nr:bifunctional phosphopantothenoylcysteine decarboxylase/phosphopantothenate--cysteine ligase CoaBC [Geminicoccaceae bacterium]
MLAGKQVLLIIGGGIAAYKTLDLIRRLRERGAGVRAVMTAAAQEFITPLSVGALTADHVFTDLFDRQAEQDVGHIRLSREADLLLVAPATADLMAKLAAGLAGDLASAVLLATDKPVLMAPAMNPRMWAHPATRRNHALLQADGVAFVGPSRGEMAERGEAGLGRMAEPLEIVAAVEAAFAAGPLAGRHVLVTSGPTHEPIDPVRYIANRSSGAQGTAIAAALRDLGARVTFVTGPATVPPPAGVTVVAVETAHEMLAAVQAALPADAAVMAAAVADWRVANPGGQKMKKDGSGRAPALEFAENPDILAWISQLPQGRPDLVVGFAAETDNVLENASAKRARKGC